MCAKCSPTESFEIRQARHRSVKANINEALAAYTRPLYSFKGHQMLCQIEVGETIYIVGRLLRPFYSNAVYRVRVTAFQEVSSDSLCVHGVLADLDESPCVSLPIPGKQLFRFDPAPVEDDDRPKLSREDIERIVRGIGLSVGFREVRGAFWVDTWKYLRTVRNEAGKKQSESKKYRLGKLSEVSQMGEEALAGLVRAKFGLEMPREEESLTSH